MPRIRHVYIYIYIYGFSISVQPEITSLLRVFSMLKNVFQKLAGLWLAGEVVNHVGLYESKVAEGCSAFQRRSCYCHVIHIWKIQQIIYTSIHPCCYHLAHNSLELHMANGTGNRGLCVPISITQGNCLMVLGKWRNAIKKRETNRKHQCSLYSFYIRNCLITNSQIYYNWHIMAKHFHFGSIVRAKWGKNNNNS